jgi:hypothetical protein
VLVTSYEPAGQTEAPNLVKHAFHLSILSRAVTDDLPVITTLFGTASTPEPAHDMTAKRARTIRNQE